MKNEFSDLLNKYLTNSITKEEEERLIVLSREEAGLEGLSAQLEEHLGTGVLSAADDPARHRQIYDHIQASIAAETPVRRIRMARIWWAAASVILLLSAGLYLWSPKQQQPIIQNDNALEQIMPGKAGAILTLANGAQLALDSLKNGVISSQNGSEIILNDNQVAYRPTGETSGAAAWNTISTPNGRQFQLELPDGSKVWLNAASSIRYPTTFTGKDRKVTITGEVYFEIAKNAQHPFKVGLGNGTEVQVLGTSFNINSYTDEPVVKTTLLEGSISMANGKGRVIMQPGEQAVFDGEQLTTRNIPSPGDEIAWKNGMFSFKEADVYTVMRQLGRWYNVKISFEGDMPDRKYNGKIDKTLSLGQVLNGLTRTHVKYRIEKDNSITILP